MHAGEYEPAHRPAPFSAAEIRRRREASQAEAERIRRQWKATGDYSSAAEDDDHQIVIVEPRHLGGAIQPAGAGAAWFMRGSRFRDNWPVTFATDDAPAIAAAAFTRGRACVLVRHEELYEEP